MKRRYIITLTTIQLLSTANVSFGQPGTVPLETMIGQMIMTGFTGACVDPSHPIVQTIQEHSIGGIILFDYNVATKSYDRNIKSPGQVRQLVKDLQSYSRIPLFVAIDYEGGSVNRLKKRSGFFDVESAETIGHFNSNRYTQVHADRMARTLSSLGFNLNFAPVVDLNLNPENPVIGKPGRSFSSDPEIVMSQANIWIETFQDYRILSVVKHFPGHGSSSTDSHLGMVDITETWQKEELLPYLKLIADDKVQAIMTAHVFHQDLDSQWPATLSYKIITELLRNKIGYQGIVISDDMQMSAISQQYGFSEAILLAVNAGVDILLFANNSTHHETCIASRVIDIIKADVQQGKISIQRIEESYHRILEAKQKCTSYNISDE